MNDKATADISIGTAAEYTSKIIEEVEKAVVGKRQTLRLMMAAFLSPGGHILLEDFPGLAKTLIANSFARAFGMSFTRIQFTPDLLPGDITGGYVFDGNLNRFTLRKGPVFTNVLLADEINRASPKTQSALLEAMQENQVTVEGETLSLPDPFIVIATQNPIEYEGTFPLPEAQLDRFMIKLSIGYPTPEEEDEILRRRTERGRDAVTLQPVITPEIFLSMRGAVEKTHVNPDVRRYMVNLVDASRKLPKVAVGASPRGSIALLKLARAHAVLEGRDYVLPDDAKLFAYPALAHRLTLDPGLWDIMRANESVVREILGSVPVPVFENANQ